MNAGTEPGGVQAHPDAGRQRWWLIPLALAHVALVLVNNAALNDGSHRLSLRTSRKSR